MVALNVIVGLRLKRFDQHPPGALARDFIQRQKLLTGFHRSLLLDYLQHRWRPPSTRLPPGFALLTQKGTPPFSCRLDPQLLVIAPAQPLHGEDHERQLQSAALAAQDEAQE